MLSVENLEKAFGGRTLFDGVRFRVNKGERVGVVGRNGHGKTTLFKIIVGDEEPDRGCVTAPGNYRIGHARQRIEFAGPTILDECMRGLPESDSDHSWKAARILSGLGFSEADMERRPDEFSGGFQARLNLAKAMVSEPDMLLLDEPTNYLDIASIRWIIRFLQDWPRELMLITHDRGFMDQVATHIVGIHRGKARKIKGDTRKYYERLASDEEIYEKTRINDENKRKEMERFITRFRAKARLAGMVQSRVKTLDKMEKKNQLEKIQSLEFRFTETPFFAKRMGTVEDLAFSYSSQPPLFSDLGFAIGARDRICVIGKNGKGKTTLVKILGGTLAPTRGKVSFHAAAKAGVFEQTHVESLAPSRTVEDEILSAQAGGDRRLARDICGAMMFSGDDALKKIEILSGGEKSRVMLGKILASPANLLVLDEPTHHLDMESCDALLAALDRFNGAVVMVTHNEMFLNALARRLIVFQDGRVEFFEGGYPEFLEKKGWGEEKDPKAMPGAPGPAAPKEKDNAGKTMGKKEMRRLRSGLIAEKAGVLAPIRKRMDALETEIEKKEENLEQINLDLAASCSENRGEKIAALSKKAHECRASIDGLYDRLEKAADEFEEEERRFDGRLESLTAS
ncbi:ABC transporter ATP-binding protein [Candidatus Desulfarcum epimagneticum]|uniref:ABC transporter ATP-binding protein n=1 Tax=uncultured Desulfobacteraceae bacterium TaxID=218296 RepID=A0A484HCC3_9BACT|nr:ABC transporter ATP-binding protein [uncultured Desulfobacteraceae bacterium]